MMAGTSPAITALPGGGYEVAFQAHSGSLWSVGADNHGDWGQPMKAGTSPAIAGLADGSYQVAYQLSDGLVRSTGPDYGYESTVLSMRPGTSPSITGIEW